MNYLRLLIIGSYLLLISILSSAQILNIEDKRLGKEEGLKGGISFSANLTQNTKTIFQTNNDILLQYKKKQHLILLINSINLMKINGDDQLINNGYQHVRYNYNTKWLNNRITLETFTQYQYNKIKHIDARLLLGTGVRFCAFNKDAGYIFISPLLMYENEKLDKANLSEQESAKNKDWRADLILSLGLNINKQVSLHNVTYFLPKIDEWNDLKLSSELGVKFKINKHFAFTSSFDIDYDSQPPMLIDELTPLPNIFYRFCNKFTISF